MLTTGNKALDDAMWAGDVDRLEELAGCECCCHEHTGSSCPARVWGGCRGQGNTEDTDEREWRDFYARHHGMSAADFYGYAEETEAA